MRTLKAFPIFLIAILLVLTACEGTVTVAANEDPASLLTTQAENPAPTEQGSVNTITPERVTDTPGGADSDAMEYVSPTPPKGIPENLSLPNCYEITYLGSTEHDDGTSTWRYRVKEEACAQDLSNWMLELPDCASILEASPSPWEYVSPDPNYKLNGIKWETGTDFTEGEFTLLLEGEMIPGTVLAGAVGPNMAVGWIGGPVCAGESITPTPSMTWTPTSTFTPTPAETEDMDTILISDNDQTLSFACEGDEVLITGNGNTITLTGQCSRITVQGNDNTVYWESGDPVITDYGNGNRIIQQ